METKVIAFPEFPSLSIATAHFDGFEDIGLDTDLEVEDLFNSYPNGDEDDVIETEHLIIRVTEPLKKEVHISDQTDLATAMAKLPAIMSRFRIDATITVEFQGRVVALVNMPTSEEVARIQSANRLFPIH